DAVLFDQAAKTGIGDSECIGGNIHRLRQIHAAKHHAGVRRSRAQGHGDLLAPMQPDAGGLDGRFKCSLLQHRNQFAKTRILACASRPAMSRTGEDGPQSCLLSHFIQANIAAMASPARSSGSRAAPPRRTPRLTQYLETPSSSTTPPHPSVYASTPSPSVDRIASAGRQIVAPTSRGLSGRMSLRRKYESRPGKQALIGLLPQESRNVVLIHPALAEGLDGGAAILAKHGRRGFHRVFVLVTRP